MTLAVKIEDLSKKYVIGHQKQERYTALRDVMMHKMRGIGQRLRHPLSPNREEIDVEEFWALKDINLEIEQGDRVGIIGRNGAGKSTLLKVLSRITEPSKGKVHINGRVSSLLEVGTGFHPELSGRENIFLNGAILGMGRNEIKRKFDEIVAFAEVEKFLDTPVKRYSSGMYVRLAFAVAAHLEPEILVVDEVLAVGDVQFQKKCLGKMEEVGKEGRTVLFVSHNMGTVEQLCQKGILLSEGNISASGKMSEVIKSYMMSGDIDSSEKVWKNADMPGNEELKLKRVSILQFSKAISTLKIMDPFVVEIETYATRNLREVMIALFIKNDHGVVVIHSTSAFGAKHHDRKEGYQVIQCVIPGGLLNGGRYSITVAADIPNVKLYFLEDNILTFSVEAISSEMNRYRSSDWKGLVGPMAVDWRIERET